MALSFLSDRSVVHQVLGRDLKFYPISVWTVFRLKGISKTIAKTIATLFEGGDGLRSSDSKETVEGGATGAYQRHRKLDAVAPNIFELRHTHKQVAIDDLVDTLMQEQNCFLLADLIIDSLRDEAKELRGMATDQKRKWLEEMGVDALMECLIGMSKANKAVFDPLVKWAQSALASVRRSDEPVPAAPAAPVAPTPPTSPTTHTGSS